MRPPAIIKQRTGGKEGSQQTVVQRHTKSPCDRKETALRRAIEKLGADKIATIRQDWSAIETALAGSEWQQSEGMIMNLIQIGLSEREIRAILRVGRLRKVVAERIDNLHTRRAPATPAHALSGGDLDFLRDDAMSWPVEDGFACARRRPKQYHLEPKITFKELHRR